jgi:hypothetical protein
VTKTFKTGTRYRVVFSLPPFVPQSLVLGQLAGNVENMSVKSLDEKRFQIEATWTATPRRFSNPLLESVEILKPPKPLCPRRKSHQPN